MFEGALMSDLIRYVTVLLVWTRNTNMMMMMMSKPPQTCIATPCMFYSWPTDTVLATYYTILFNNRYGAQGAFNVKLELKNLGKVCNTAHFVVWTNVTMTVVTCS